MYFSTAVIAAFAATYVSATPLMARGNTCGSAPAGSANNQPISQPSGCQTSLSCQAQCEANSSCKSFCFGMVDNTIECKLYSCAASAVPKQPSSNLVVYDKACSAVPSVVPTSSNPTGKKVDNNQSQSNSDSGSKASNQKADNNQSKSNSDSGSKTSSQKAQESPKAESDNSSSQKSTEAKQVYGTQKQSTQKESSSKSSSSAKTCGTKPSASTNNQPMSTPSVTSEDACKAKCQANSSCKSFTCGKVENKMVCKLYSVAAAQVPAPSTTAQKNALKAYDVGCSI